MNAITQPVLGSLLLIVSACAAPANADEGGAAAKLYQSKCAMCHGKDAKGSAPMAKSLKSSLPALDLIDPETLGKTEEELASLTAKGKGKMPAYEGKLKPEEIAGVIAYVRGLAGSGKAASAAAKGGKAAAGSVDLAAAAKAFGANCATCHGADGKGKPAMAKMFKLEPAAMDLVAEASQAKADEELVKAVAAGKGKMPAFKGKLPADQIRALVAYVRSLAGPKTEAPKQKTTK